MKSRNVLGAVLSFFGAILGMLITPVLFMDLYIPLMEAEAALGGSALGCEAVVVFIFPFISDLGVVAGALYFVAGIGFLSDDKRAFSIAIVANVLALQSSFWPIIPLLVTSLPPLFAIVFLPNILMFFLFMGPVGRKSGKLTLLALIMGMAWVLAFMNGVASTNRLVVLNDQPIVSMFVAAQRLNWIASIGFGVATIGLALNPKEWVRKVGLGAAIIEVVIGYPSGIYSPFGGGFSMFLLAPIMATIVLVLLISPKVWEKFGGKRES